MEDKVLNLFKDRLETVKNSVKNQDSPAYRQIESLLEQVEEITKMENIINLDKFKPGIMSSEEMSVFSDLCNDILSGLDSILNNLNDYVEFQNSIPLLQETRRVISNYNKVVQKGIEDNKEEMPLEEILKNPDFIKNIFTTDTTLERDRPDYVKGKFTYDIKSNDWGKALQEYINVTNIACQCFYKHMEVLTGSRDHFQESLEIKTALLDAYISQFSIDGSYKAKICQYANAYKELNIYFRPDLTEDYSKLLNKNLFEFTIDHFVEDTEIAGLLDKQNNLPAQAKANIKEELKKLRINPSAIGVPFELIEQADTYVNYFFRVQDFINTLSNSKYNAEDLHMHMHEGDFLYPVVVEADRIKVKITNILKGKIDSSELTSDDYSVFLNALKELIENSTVFEDDSVFINGDFSQALKTYVLIKEDQPLYDKNKDPFLEKCRERIKQAYEQTCSSILSSANNISALKKYTSKIHNLMEAGYCKYSAYMTTIYTGMLLNPQFLAQKEKDYSASVKTAGTKNEVYYNAVSAVMVTQIINAELAKARASLNPAISPEQHIKNHTLPVFEKIAQSKTLSLKDMEEFDEYITSCLSQASIKKFMGKDLQAVKNALKDDNAKKATYNELFPRTNWDTLNLAQDTYKALWQDSGTLGSHNSTSYEAIRKAIRQVNAFPDAGNRSYDNLYVACRNYMNTHNSDPTYPNGKLRFNAAAEVAAKTGILLAEAEPALREKIIKDYTLNMIRSKTFRDHTFAIVKDRISLINSIYKPLTEDRIKNLDVKIKRELELDLQLLTIGSAIEERLKNHKNSMIDGKLKAADSGQKLLEKYSAINEITRILQKAVAERPEVLIPELMHDTVRKNMSRSAMNSYKENNIQRKKPEKADVIRDLS